MYRSMQIIMPFYWSSLFICQCFESELPSLLYLIHHEYLKACQIMAYMYIFKFSGYYSLSVTLHSLTHNLLV